LDRSCRNHARGLQSQGDRGDRRSADASDQADAVDQGQGMEAARKRGLWRAVCTTGSGRVQHMRYFVLAAFLWLMIAPIAIAAETTGQPGAATQQVQPKIDRRKLIVPPRNPDGSIIMTPFWEDPKQWIMEQQRVFYGAMAGSMRSIKSDAPVAAAATLI